MMILQKHGPTIPVIEVEKRSYDESSNVLELIVYLKENVTLSSYSVTIKYNKMDPYAYDSGSAINPDGGCEVPLNESGYTCGGGDINLTGQTDDGSETTTTRKTAICTIRFKLKEDLLEEELPENLFTVEETIIENDEGTYEEVYSGIVNIGPMASTIDTITISDAKFDYTTDTDGDATNDAYKYGENINLIGGTATITYSNTKNGSTRTAILKNVDGEYSWFETKGGSETGKKLDITKGPWKANTVGTQNVNVEYEGKTSNSVGVKVVDQIENITVTPVTEYYYGDEFDYENTKVNIKWKSKEAPEVKSLKELVDNNQATLTNDKLQGVAKEIVEQEISVNFDYAGYTGTQEFTVTIEDKIKDITLDHDSMKKRYKYKEEALDISNGSINIEWYSGTEVRPLVGIKLADGSSPVKENNSLQGLRESIIVSDSVKITGFNNSVCGTNTINIEYSYTDKDEETQTKTGLTYDIEIVDYIEQIVFTPVVDYLYNEDFDTENSKVSIKWASKDAAEETTLSDLIENGHATINDFNSSAEEIKKSLDGVKQNVTITFKYEAVKDGIYEDYERTTEPFEVTIKDQIEEITFDEPDKKDYDYQDPALDLTGGVINIKWLSGEIEERPLNNIEIKEGSSPIINNNTENSHLNDSILVTGFDSSIYGTNIITIKYYYVEEPEPEEFTYNIKINVGIKSITLNKNEISIPYGQVITDEYLKTNNYNIIITNSDDTTRNPIQVKAEWIGEYDKTKEKIGVRQETYVNYNGTKIPVFITIENCLDHIELTKNMITVKWGEEINFTEEYKVIPVMANGDKEEGIAFTESTVRLEGYYDLKDEGIYKVQVIYEGKKADFTIVVVDPIIEVRLDDDEKEKIQKEYKYDEELNLNGAKLTIIKESGEYKETISKNWTDYDKQKLGIQKININYKDDETQEVFTLEECFEVEVKDYIVDIVLVKPNKTVYLPNEKLDLTGATVRTISASGKLGDEVPVDENMISGYTEGVLGAQRITVNYEGFEKTFDVIFTAQTGVASSNVYTILTTIIAVASITIIAMLTIIKKEEEQNKKM